VKSALSPLLIAVTPPRGIPGGSPFIVSVHFGESLDRNSRGQLDQHHLMVLCARIADQNGVVPRREGRRLGEAYSETVMVSVCPDK
jgi:hypothetical protein